MKGKYRYKGNLHAHTTLSDGNLSPEECADYYRKHGYSFICFSEHDVYTDLRAEIDSDEFITLPGIEASVNLFSSDGRRIIKKHHIHGILGNREMCKNAENRLLEHGEKVKPINMRDRFDGPECAQRVVDDLTSRGMFTTYNHPVWSRIRMDDIDGIQNIWAIEIYNYESDVTSGEGKDTFVWADFLREGNRVLAVAADDNHNRPENPDSFGGFVAVAAERLTHEDIVNALLAGDYYSSMGPEIYECGIEKKELVIRCSPVQRISFITGGYVGTSVTINAGGSQLCEGRYSITGEEQYIRVEITDSEGKTAWSNPFYPEPPLR